MMRVADISLAVIGVLLALIRLLGFVFFAETNSFALAVPAIVMLAVVLLPLKILSRKHWVLASLVVLYLGSYAFGGLDRMIKYDRLMPDLLELSIIGYFIVRAITMRGLTNRPNVPEPN